MSDPLLHRVQNIIIKSLANPALQNISPHENLLTSGFIDSLKFIDMVTLFEQEFDIKFPQDVLSLENFNTASAISNLIQKLRSNMK